MASASTVSFTIGGTTVTVNGPGGSTDVTAMPRFAVDRSANNTTWSYQYTNTAKWTWSMTLLDLTAAQKTAIENFFHNSAVGPANVFTYVHTDGASYANCRFLSTELKWQRVCDALWNLPLVFESPNQVA